MGNGIWIVFVVALGVRVLNALVSRTFFQPDEYWQSLEPAHRLVFGYGYQTWEWRPLDGGSGIRSPLYPFVFVPVYWLLKFTGLDQGWLFTLAPRLLQAVAAAACDVSTFVLARRLFGPRYGNAAAFCSLTSFFNAYTSTRTFSNSTETALTTAALALWPWDGVEAEISHELKDGKPVERHFSTLAGALSLAAAATLLRPSNVIIWVVVGLSLLSSSPSRAGRIKIMSTAIGIAVLATAVCFAVDSMFYGVPAFTPYTFLVQNVVNSISLFYGSNPLHFYLSQALPFTMMTMLPFALHGIYKSRHSRTPRLAAGVVLATLGVYSLLGHKEFRFIHPILPLLHCFAAFSLVSLFPIPSTSAPPHGSFARISIRPLHAGLILLSLVPAIYLTAFHSLAQTTIMESLRQVPPDELRSVAFLMPCHSTPWQSHLHRPDLEVAGPLGSGEGGRLWFLACEPPVLGQDASTYRDQSDFFYASPTDYLLTRFPPSVNPSFPPSPFVPPHSASTPSPSNDLGWTHEWPSHVVVFDALLKADNATVARVLEERGYREQGRLWNSHWHEDERRRGDVVVLRWARAPE